jgi:hypothetical protein
MWQSEMGAMVQRRKSGRRSAESHNTSGLWLEDS